MTSDELLAYEAIKRTVNLYNLSGDSGRLDDLASTFTPDGQLIQSHVTFAGRQEILAGLRSGMGPTTPPKFVRHNITTMRIDLTGPDTAKGRIYFLVLTEIGLDRSGVYSDDYEQRDGQWLIRRRKVRLDFIAENSRLPRPGDLTG